MRMGSYPSHPESLYCLSPTPPGRIERFRSIVNIDRLRLADLGIVNQKEVELILLHQSNDLTFGYNQCPRGVQLQGGSGVIHEKSS
jgi:hypothetical protein